MSKIELKNVSYIYSAKTPFEIKAVDDISFTINSGEFIGLIGPTGAGKSTLIQHINGLLKPTSGNVFIDGTDIFKDKKTLHSIRFKVGLVFQYPENQLFEETVFEDIAFGPKNMGLKPDEIKTRVIKAAAALEAEHILKKSPFDLSGGQQRRVAIAGVLAMEPSVLILDEPTSGLDPRGRERVLTLINNYHKQTGSTIILVSHNMEDIAKYADRVLVLNNFKIKSFDTVPNTFKHGDQLAKIGLDIPMLTGILQKLRSNGLDVSEDVYTIDEAVEEVIKCIK